MLDRDSHPLPHHFLQFLSMSFLVRALFKPLRYRNILLNSTNCKAHKVKENKNMSDCSSLEKNIRINLGAHKLSELVSFHLFVSLSSFYVDEFSDTVS